MRPCRFCRGVSWSSLAIEGHPSWDTGKLPDTATRTDKNPLYRLFGAERFTLYGPQGGFIFHRCQGGTKLRSRSRGNKATGYRSGSKVEARVRCRDSVPAETQSHAPTLRFGTEECFMQWSGNEGTPNRPGAHGPCCHGGPMEHIIRPAIAGREPMRFLSYSGRSNRRSPSGRNLLRRELRDKQDRADRTRTLGARIAHDYW